MTDLLVNALLQLLAFLLIPFVVWLVLRKTSKTDESFFRWIGLKKIETDHAWKFWLLFGALFSGTCLVSMLVVPYIIGQNEAAMPQFSGEGVAAIPAVLIHSIIQTGLSEEILFRGFIGKRCMARFGFAVGNLVQATLFGLVHGILFFQMIGVLRAVVFILLTGGIGWIQGYINEKKAGGSIVPSWIFHSLTNIASGLSAAFVLM